MKHRDFVRAVDVIQKYGHKVLVEDNYSESQLIELLLVLSSMFREAGGK